MSENKNSDYKEITKLLRIVEEFRKQDAEMPLQTAATLLIIAQREGLSFRELSQTLGMAQSTTSRNVSLLSDWYAYGKAGLGLVEAKEDPMERRKKKIELTPKGRRVIDSLVDITKDP